MDSRFKFFEDETNKSQGSEKKIEVQQAFPQETEKVKTTFKEDVLRYRSEQIVIIKIDGIIENHADTKLEYVVKKIVEQDNIFVKVELVDQVIKIQPTHLQESMDLMSKIDTIKSNALVKVNPNTGRIRSVENLDEITKNWLDFRKSVEMNTSFIQSSEMKKNIETYLDATALQFSEEQILEDFRVRPFFDLFFDKYLVSDDLDVKNRDKLYYSQLFDRLPLQLNVVESIISETQSLIGVKKDATLDRKNSDMSHFAKIYDFKYKPKIGYKFDNYNFEHHSQMNYDLRNNILQDAWMTISEDVTNNIEVFVDYKIRRVN